MSESQGQSTMAVRVSRGAVAAWRSCLHQQTALAPVVSKPARGFADKVQEKGRGDERVHFAKEDERALRSAT